MGTVASNANGADDLGALSNIPQNIRSFELKVDLAKEVHPTLKQLQFWSLSDIRQVYEKFQRRSNIPFLDVTLFCKVVPFTRTNAMYIFKHFCKNINLLSVYEFLCVLVICAYTHYVNKIHCIFFIQNILFYILKVLIVLFDLDCNGSISLNELLIIFKSVFMGYCKLTETEIPTYGTLEKFAKLMFLKSDIQADNSLELKEIIEWVEGNGKAMELFARFEPQYKIKENFEVFRFFRKYREEDSQEILKLINQAYQSEYYHSDIQKMMGNQGKVGYLATTKNRQNKMFSQILPKLVNNAVKETQAIAADIGDQELLEMEIIEKAIDSHAKKYDNKNDKIVSNSTLPQIKISSPTKHKSHISKNIIIIQGNTLTRQEIFKLKDYFDKLSDHNNQITIKEFTKAFSDKPHMKRVTASLFNFLDSKQRGTVTFEQLLIKLYPSLTKTHLKLINNWINQYVNTFSIENQGMIIDNNDNKQVKRKRVLPRAALKRVQEVFELLDVEKKGYITPENFKAQYKYGYTQKEIEEIFEKHNKEKDGKLSMDDFIKMILPLDYTIGEEEEN
ncbi:hypothetical protein IMG5_094380 [Ichthyophthirius multifiliis]|uniref:EF-hand domain-containing protein n=1 Tax=Ichthyophthirius multifiliis TaxID=5932 RepID=G0QRJ8_ICHMU|nr:hypothetical protein IMG5_094380 [Ichthyophthirius multifiliis]EGR32152.1 hypothetical protein IMG5_094380 [Ichthyophthirius multifiliis]|eukprot:XP_004035638.1 hypothetical protein IMG5_094380 [Ichthyophthirius multifiliis]